jgi:hypothetical protein
LWIQTRLDRSIAESDARQCDIWEISRSTGTSRFAVSWRDLDGRVDSVSGLYDSLVEVEASLKADYDLVDIWSQRAE